MSGTPHYPWSRGDTLYAERLNEAFVNKVERSGDTMLGPLGLVGDPVSALQATTKQYVDTQIAANMGGGGGGGTTITVSDTAPAVPVVNQLWWDSVGCNLYLWYNDGNTSQWVNVTNPLTGSSIYNGDSAPVSPVTNMLWFNTTDLQLYIYYYDGNSSQWVPVNNQSAGVGEAPSDGNYYVRRNAGWTTPYDAAQFNRGTGRNYVDNPGFHINQRAISSTSASGYMVDRWMVQNSVDTTQFVLSPATDAMRTQLGTEDIQSYMNCSLIALGSAGSYSLFCQRLMDVRRFAGKQIAISFHANATLNSLKVGVSIDQNFGTGGSPSAPVQGSGTGIQISGGTTWRRYMITLAVPSVVGKVFGTNADDYTQLNLWLSSGSTNATRSGIGVQTGQSIGIWGIQLELGQVTTPFERINVIDESAHCQYFYTRLQMQYYGYGGAGQTVAISQPLAVKMRATPVVAIVSTVASTNITSPASGALGNGILNMSGVVTATSSFALQLIVAATADL